MPSIGPLEVLIIIAVLILLFGATRITDLGEGMGKSIRRFREELRHKDDE
jgi:sec-independent protein translocase protein TatA